jgi:3-oxoacyl-[acyl-carrier protein] reductase
MKNTGSRHQAKTALSTPSATKVAMVTGSSRGIGAAIAKRMAADGHSVVVNYAGSEAEAQAIVQGIQAARGRAVAIKADVSILADVAALFDRAEAEFGGVGFLVNNAGTIQLGPAPLADTDDALFDRLVGVNMKGTFNGLRIAANRLRAGGRIVNFSSSAVGVAPAGYSVYSATKSAIETMTKIFAKELRGRGICVNAVAPGPTATGPFLNGKNSEQIAQIAKLSPLDRIAQPDDIAAVVSFLVGPDGAWVNGQTLRVNGGTI